MMADETKNEDDDLNTPEEEEPDDTDFGALSAGESTLGNLPPLSDFDSAESDSGLPPLSGMDSDPESGPTSGGLPPIDEINVETPNPTGGAIRPAPPEFGDESAFDTPTTQGGLDTPNKLDTPEPSSPGMGFQDLAADSDFSPETPEIGPGPDSDIDTPMFDSAFGGVDDSSFGDMIDTPAPAPTQAMETPMFETGDTPTTGDDLGFDAGAFGADDFSAGTPVPDFSPDTGVPPAGEPQVAAPEPKKKRVVASGGPGGLTLVAMLLVAFVIGAGGVFALYYGDMGFMPNPGKVKVAEEKDSTITGLQNQIARIRETGPGGPGISPEEIDELIRQRDQLLAEVGQLNSEYESVSTNLDSAQRQLEGINEDIQAANLSFADAAEQLEELQNETALVEARHDGLQAENERLTEQVGQLESANTRRIATKDTLEHNINMLLVQVREGIPLTPQKYARDTRLEKVEALKAKVTAANWVTPELLNEYTDLYLDELAIAESNTYFFAKVPVEDNLGNSFQRWAECVMNGNKSVFYQTIDGKHVGVFENVNTAGGPKDYQFNDDITGAEKKRVVEAIKSARTEDYREKIAILEGKQSLIEARSGIQRAFSAF